MAHHPTPTALPAGFRRRFPLELSPDEYETLEAAGRSHGSKRAALLAGLAALDGGASRDRDLARAAAERDAALATIAELEGTIAELERAQASARGTSTRAKKDADSVKTALAEMSERAEAARADWRGERAARIAAEKKLHALIAERVDELRCPRCGEFARPSEWAEEPTPEGRLVFHKPCGFHRGGLLDHTSVLGRRHR